MCSEVHKLAGGLCLTGSNALKNLQLWYQMFFSLIGHTETRLDGRLITTSVVLNILPLGHPNAEIKREVRVPRFSHTFLTHSSQRLPQIRH